MVYTTSSNYNHNNRNKESRDTATRNVMVLLNAVIVTTMLPGLKLAAFWVAQVIE